MYWTPAQQLAHMTVNGAPIRTGDLYASRHGERRRSTTSAARCSSCPGAAPSRSRWPTAATRTFLEDGDEVTISATAPGPDGTRIGFGEVTGTVRPART